MFFDHKMHRLKDFNVMSAFFFPEVFLSIKKINGETVA